MFILLCRLKHTIIQVWQLSSLSHFARPHHRLLPPTDIAHFITPPLETQHPSNPSSCLFLSLIPLPSSLFIIPPVDTQRRTSLFSLFFSPFLSSSSPRHPSITPWDETSHLTSLLSFFYLLDPLPSALVSPTTRPALVLQAKCVYSHSLQPSHVPPFPSSHVILASIVHVLLTLHHCLSLLLPYPMIRSMLCKQFKIQGC